MITIIFFKLLNDIFFIIGYWVKSQASRWMVFIKKQIQGKIFLHWLGIKLVKFYWGLVCLMENSFLESGFQSFLCLFVCH
jgi:hypothetical protein